MISLINHLGLFFVLLLSIMLSCLGYGWFLTILLRKSSTSNYVDELFLGVSILVFLGGVLNFFGLVSRFGNRTIIAFGISLSFVMFASKRKIRSTIFNLQNLSQLPFFIMLGMLTIASRITRTAWNYADDGEAYLPFVKKMLTLGSLAFEPFSERRFLSSLGGSTFLDSLVVSILDFNFIRLSDMGLGISLMLILIWNLHQRKVLTGSPFLSAVPILLPFPVVNISSLFLSAALFLYILTKLLFPANQRILSAIHFIFPLATLFSLKNSNLVACLLMLLFFSNQIKGRMFPGSFRDISYFVVKRLSNSVLFLALTSPWLLGSLKDESSLSFFHDPRELIEISEFRHYPIFDFANLDDFFLFWGNLLNSSLLFVVFIAFIVLLVSPVTKTKMELFVIAKLIFISLVCGYVLTIQTDGYGVDRYTFALNFAILMGIIFCFSRMFSSLSLSLLTFLLISLTIYPSILKISPAYTLATLKQSFEISSISNNPCTEKTAISALQDKTEKKSTILVTSSFACALDFSRNVLLLNDFPGMLSPHPGLPLSDDFVRMKEYLISKDIDYLLVEMPSEEYRRYLNTVSSDVLDSKWLLKEAALKLRYYDLVESARMKFPMMDGPNIFYLIPLART